MTTGFWFFTGRGFEKQPEGDYEMAVTAEDSLAIQNCTYPIYRTKFTMSHGEKF